MRGNGASPAETGLSPTAEPVPVSSASAASIPSAGWDFWVLDATMGVRSGLFCFCPAEALETDETFEISEIVTGFSVLSGMPPGRLIAIVHEDGQEAVEEFCAQNEAALEALAQAIEARRAATTGAVRESAVTKGDAP